MAHKLGQLVSLNLSLDTKGSKKWKLLQQQQQWPQISEIEDPKRKIIIIELFIDQGYQKEIDTHILELSKVKISRLWRGWFFNLFGRHFWLGRLYRKRCQSSLGWFVTLDITNRNACVDVSSSFELAWNQSSDLTGILISDEIKLK